MPCREQRVKQRVQHGTVREPCKVAEPPLDHQLAPGSEDLGGKSVGSDPDLSSLKFEFVRRAVFVGAENNERSYSVMKLVLISGQLEPVECFVFRRPF